MRVAIAGGHGQIAMQLGRLLVDQGDHVVGLIRNPDHAADVRRSGVQPEICDLEQASEDEIAASITGSDALVFAAGAGPGSGAARKLTVDRDGAIKMLNATARDVRYVMLSGIGAENPPVGDDAFSVYLRAKGDADAAVMASGREWTIVRPVGFTDDPGTGRIRVASAPFEGRIPRADVAAFLAAVVHEPRARDHVLYVAGGTAPIAQALADTLRPA